MAVVEEVHYVVAAVHHALVLGVQEVHVVELAEVVHHRLPVAVVVHGLVFGERHLAEAVRRQHVGQRPEVLLQRGRVVGHADEHEPVPDAGVHGFQRALGEGHAGRELILVGNDVQVAVHVVGPGVIGAAEAVGVAALGAHQAVAPVLADVVEGAHPAARAAGDQNLFAAQVEHEEVAGLGDVAFKPRKQPAPGPDALPTPGPSTPDSSSVPC